jgi:hypothetical protein
MLKRGSLAIIAALLCGIAAAGDKPRWMSPEAGWVDEETDTRIEEVVRDEASGGYRVRISVPKVEKPIEEVLVVGERIDQPTVELPVQFEVINDLDNDRSGIILYVGTTDPFALRINYHDGTQKAIPKDPGLTIR